MTVVTLGNYKAKGIKVNTSADGSQRFKKVNDSNLCDTSITLQ